MYCAYNEGFGTGIKKIPLEGDIDLQRCANKCYQMKLDVNKYINGATLDKTKCFCEVSQGRTVYSKEKTNCQFKTEPKPVKGKHCVYLFLHIQRTPKE